MHPCSSRSLAAAIAALILSAATAQAAPANSDTAAVEKAVATLRAQADELFTDKTENRLSMSRPDPAVAPLGPELCPEILKALAQKMSGDPAKDMYVRYHLMDVVNRALPTLTKPLDRELIQKLIHAIPEDIKYTEKSVYSWDPYEIGKRHFELMQSCVVSVGFAPFIRRVGAPDSFQYMQGAQLAAAKAAYAEAKSLEGKFKDTYVKANDLYDWRMGSMAWALRQYRGELYYAALVKDPPALADLTQAILRAAPVSTLRATDLASFLDLAYSNGILATYDTETLNAAVRQLKSAVAASPKGKNMGWENWGYGTRWRNLAEALFMVITGMENAQLPPPIAAGAYARPVPPAPPVPTAPAKAPTTQPAIKPEEITAEDIDAAINRALPALERLRPPDTDLDSMSYRVMDLPTWPEDLWRAGQGALSTWAMLAAGEPYRAGWMQRRANWVLCLDTPNTYDRAMRLEMLNFTPPSGKKAMTPRLKADVAWLIDTQTEMGGWEAENTTKRSAGWGDNVNSQYAMLGLWGATQAGIEVPDAMWQRIDHYWRAGQRPPGSPGEGAWAVIPTASLKKDANLKDFSNHVSASMTAGGVLSLFITESFLYGDKRADVGQSLSPELLRGVQWLDDNFSLDHLDGDSDFYYYIWTIQNVGQATGYRTFNKIDWFREATARLLNTQEPTGLWTGPKGDNVSTSFALLYLYAAKGPLAICKLHIEPVVELPNKTLRPVDKSQANAWNNRPNDLYNFTRDITRNMEVPTSWQIADLDQPVYQLIESPILYLATNLPFKLKPEHVARLREYLDAGGMLVCVPEGSSPGPVLKSMKELASELGLGDAPIARKNNDDHPFYNLFAKVKGDNLPTLAYENDVRPLMVIVQRDIGRDLQMNRIAQREAFDLLDNIYLYAAGMNSRRPRVSTNFLTQHNLAPKTKLAVARLKHAGDFDPEPLAMPQLKAMMADRFNVNLNLQTLSAAQLTPVIKVAFLTVTGKATLNDDEAAAARKWVDAGGTLWVDAVGEGAAGAQAAENLHALLPKLGMTDPQSLAGNPILTGKGLDGGFDNREAELRKFSPPGTERPRLQAKLIGTHPAILAFDGDLTSGLAGMNHWEIAGYTPAAARDIVANSLLWTIKENAPPPPPPARNRRRHQTRTKSQTVNNHPQAPDGNPGPSSPRQRRIRWVYHYIPGRFSQSPPSATARAPVAACP